MKILIENGNIVGSTDNYTADIYIQDGKIQTIGKNLNKSYFADKKIDATGLYVFPAGIDPHTHLEMPWRNIQSSDDFETGSIAALCGGTTTIIDYAIQEKGQGLQEGFNKWLDKAKKSVIDYSFHMTVSDFNDKAKEDIPELIKSGVTSFKALMAYKGTLMLEDRDLFELLIRTKKYGGLVAVHTENGDVIDYLIKDAIKNGNLSAKYHPLTRPPIVEGEAAGRVIDLAKLANAPLYIVHMTAKDSLDKVKNAILRNQMVYAETCIQYLVLDDSVYQKDGFESAKYVMSPPIRSKEHQEELWKGIQLGLIKVVATDHCPFNFIGDKEIGKDNFSNIPNGAPGIENRISLLYHYGVNTGKITLNKFVDLISTSAAKIFGMFPQKGCIAIGSDADIVLFDPNQEQIISSKTQHQRVDYNMYEGFKLKGSVKTVIMGGKIAFEDGKLNIEKASGKFIPRKTFY